MLNAFIDTYTNCFFIDTDIIMSYVFYDSDDFIYFIAQLPNLFIDTDVKYLCDVKCFYHTDVKYIICQIYFMSNILYVKCFYHADFVEKGVAGDAQRPRQLALVGQWSRISLEVIGGCDPSHAHAHTHTYT